MSLVTFFFFFKYKGLWNDMLLICWINKCFLKTNTFVWMWFFFCFAGWHYGNHGSAFSDGFWRSGHGLESPRRISANKQYLWNKTKPRNDKIYGHQYVFRPCEIRDESKSAHESQQNHIDPVVRDRVIFIGQTKSQKQGVSGQGAGEVLHLAPGLPGIHLPCEWSKTTVS